MASAIVLGAQHLTIEERVEEAQAFFESLYPAAAAIKLRLPQAELQGRGTEDPRFIEGRSRFAAFGMRLQGWLYGRMERADNRVEVFYCPTPMTGTDGRKKYQVAPTNVTVAFSDADFGLTPAAHHRLTSMGACLVQSGGVTDEGQIKYHIYLRLSRSVTLDELEKINRGIKIYINGDKFDATSLLRIPGTRNHKYPQSPLVRVETYATQTHTPESLMAEFPIPSDTVSGVELEGLKLPEIPDDFRFSANEPGYFKMRREVRNWNSRFEAGNVSRRYAASVALVKEAIKAGLSVDIAYAFASHCEPLLDKEQEEDGYDIRKDIARTYYRETKTQTSGLTVEEFTREATSSNIPAPTEPSAAERRQSTTSTASTTSTTPTSHVKESTDSQSHSSTDQSSHTPFDSNMQGGSLPPIFGEGIPFSLPNLDEILSGEYTPLEPSLVTCGSYFLLYPGKSHGLSSDRGLGKTHVTIAMVHDIMRKGGRVAYFDFEDTPDTFIRDRMMNQHGIPAEMIRRQFMYIGGIVKDIEMGDMEPSDAIKIMAQALKGWDLVVIDGVAASMADWSIDDSSPTPMLDGSKATDYAWWHSRQVKPFLDEGIATLQIDHTTKNGGRVSGTLQKGAKLTGVEYELRAAKLTSSLTMGATGRLVLSAVKDRVGRIIRFKRRHVPADQPEAFHDVAEFVMTSDLDGKITRALFEPVNDAIPATALHSAGNPDAPVLSDRELEAMRMILAATTPMNKSGFAKKMGGQTVKAYSLLESLQHKGLIDMVEGSRGALNIVPVASAHQTLDNITSRAASSTTPGNSPTPENHTPGEPLTVDFTEADSTMPRAAKRTRECRKCREHYTYPDAFAKPDDIGYNPKRPMCRECAAENIDSEPVPLDGAEWARKVRERITGRRRASRPGDRP